MWNLIQVCGILYKVEFVMIIIQATHHGYDAQSKILKSRDNEDSLPSFVTNIVIIGCRACQCELFLFNQATNKNLSTTEQKQNQIFPIITLIPQVVAHNQTKNRKQTIQKRNWTTPKYKIIFNWTRLNLLTLLGQQTYLLW